MRQGDIYLVSLDPTLGHEQQGMRPVLVLSSTAFNEKTRLPIVAAISTGGSFARVLGLTVSLSGCGTRTTGVVRCDQVRSLDIAARHGKRLEVVPAAITEEVLQVVATIFGL